MLRKNKYCKVGLVLGLNLFVADKKDEGDTWRAITKNEI